MSLLNIFKQAKLSTLWKYETSGIVWRLLPTSNHLLIGEERNIEEKRVSFFCVDALSGRVLWNNVSFNEPWWIGIEQVHRNILFLHEYASPDLPEHKKVYAVELESSKLLWVNEEVQFQFAHNDFVYVSKIGFEERYFYEAELPSGKIVRQVPATEIIEIQSAGNNDETMNIHYPAMLTENELQHGVVKNVFRKMSKSPLYGEMIEHCEKVIVSYYESANNNTVQEKLYQQHFVIADASGRIFYDEIINKEMKYPVPDSFLCIDEIVYFIKNRNMLTAVKLVE